MDFFVNKYLWTPIVFLQYFFISYLSIKASETKSNHFLFAVWITGILPTWTIIASASKNIALHGYVFDFILAAGWSLGIIIFQGKSFGIFQYLGIAAMVAGLMLFKKQ